MAHKMLAGLLGATALTCVAGAVQAETTAGNDAATLGEIVVTGGENPNLPLVRYRTGDFAALDFGGTIPRLVNFTGRRPVHFRSPSGQTVSSIDVTVGLFDIPLPFFSLHQLTGGGLTFRTRCDEATQARVEEALGELFGTGQALTIEQLPLDHVWEGKWIQYSSEGSTP